MLVRLPNTATSEQITAALKEHGYVIVEDLVPASVMDAIEAEMAPHIKQSPYGSDGFLGGLTQRTGAMISRSPTSRNLVMNPVVLGAAKQHLAHASTFQLHLTQVITVHPGSPAQILHRDELAWDFFPFPHDYEVQCNLLWAMTDYTEENGATRIVPGSHRAGTKEKYSPEAGIPAVMKRGSALFYTGKIYHGAGENRSGTVRQAINITYAVGWVRQEENQYLSTPLEQAKTLPDDLLKVMGYQCGCFAIGYVRDFEDPLAVLRGQDERVTAGFSVVRDTQNKDAANYRELVK
ncbi:phytanoyl-CoA dioxygenase family protein [Pseudomonas typographi]|uniref:Phytanoyl-CoA dioxygenase family protein n=1 Tax=Pseudomonas typographi TaxID=2715964 RepID=A0ABR7Z1Q8_9PSED|nr:phytanoyl-CoA dioxygenase family protein [Pseudomonas typographi]MBD1551528.1 phytanoyl-CoA dioxygenase family protein [Pseudomonas typographi]MBD1587486.1 phytanoyl-CoA dioxygenase family protein [Pseudomonas typographi]MBD1599431.1 phytanoyl-CoA dioxygenase family protein [Pseudomonas typographi]